MSMVASVTWSAAWLRQIEVASPIVLLINSGVFSPPGLSATAHVARGEQSLRWGPIFGSWMSDLLLEGDSAKRQQN